ncbi:MAG TPA: hypothetical protein EYN91_08710 [Candidatus Melainabacteria bacterium]|nr:hypothetical protein [Candidatus Melainabacteria bacterium]HIN64112.1 hypothetical protein [Candidatus Obscuribacterales bacterium]
MLRFFLGSLCAFSSGGDGGALEGAGGAGGVGGGAGGAAGASATGFIPDAEALAFSKLPIVDGGAVISPSCLPERSLPKMPAAFSPLPLARADTTSGEPGGSICASRLE